MTPINPEHLVRYLGPPAAGLLHDYFNSGRYTGGRFERFAHGGDNSETAAQFTSDDIVAVSLLGVRIPGRAALAILESQATRLNTLLSKVPVAEDLWQTSEETIGPDSSAAYLWQELVELPGINWVTAAKLLARKRPRLIPVYDRVVKTALHRQDADEWWRPLRTVLFENADIIAKLAQLRAETSLGQQVSLLRILDVSIWMREHGAPEPTPDAES